MTPPPPPPPSAVKPPNLVEGNEPLLLIPAPRQVRRSPGFAAISRHTEPVVSPLASAKGPEHYTLAVTAEPGHKPQVEIRAAGPAAERAARATLAQLRRRFKDHLPLVEIEDWPAFAVRGIMLDVSRDRVPTMAEFVRILDLLASLKINHLQLYTEHTFAYAGHDDVWQGWGALSPEETRRLDALCRERGIELAANQNCFGHLAHWLRMDRYKDLAETHGDWMFDLWPRSGPFSLCPTDPRSIGLVRDMLTQLTGCIASPLVNIGCDETFDVGWGKSKAEVDRRAAASGLTGKAATDAGRASVYIDFVNAIAKECKALGKTPMFWADIALSHPETVDRLDKDLVFLAWGYEADSPFDRWCEHLRSLGRPVWVCPGTSTWRTITGRTHERHANLRAAARAGVKHNAQGFLITDWGDTGHWQQWPISAHGIAHGAHAAWTGDADTFDPHASALHALGTDATDLGPWLERLGDADLPLREVCLALSRPLKPGEPPRLRNQTALMIDLFKRLDEQTDVGSEWLWFNAHQSLQNLREEFEEAIEDRLPPLLADELVHTLDLAVFAAVRGWVRRLDPRDRPVTREDLLGWLDDITAEHRRLWAIRSRCGSGSPKGLEHSCNFFKQVRATLEPR